MATNPLLPQSQNPVLAEIQSHVASMSPHAQAAIKQALPMQGVSNPPDGGAVRSISPITDPHAQPQVPPIGAAPMNPDPQGSLRPGGSNPPMPILPPTSSPQVHPPTQTDVDQSELARKVNTGSGISQIHSKIENSGFGQAHPLLGKVLGWGAQIPATLADVATSAVAPAITANLPGTEYHHDRLVRQDQRQVAQDIANEEKQGQTAEAGARTGLANEQTAEMPGKTASEQALQGAQTGNLQSETYAREHPKEQWKALTGMVGPNGEPVEYEATSGKVRLGDVSGLSQLHQPKPDSPEQQYIDEYQRVHQGSSIADAEKQYTLDTQRPPQIAPLMMMVPGANGSSTATVVRPGQTVAPGTTTAAGLSGESVAANKQDAAAQKAKSDMQHEYALAQQLVAHPSPTNDVALVMRYIGATKPDSMGKLRLNQNEVGMVMGTRSSFGDLEALEQKVRNGQSLIPQQRQDMLGTMKLLADAGGGGTEGGQYQEGQMATGPNGHKIKFTKGQWVPQ